jgi:hypothetical protein
LSNVFIASRWNKQEKSPWNGYVELWAEGWIASNQAECNTVAVQAFPGQILFCFYPEQDHTIESIFVSATDNNFNLVYQKSVSAY